MVQTREAFLKRHFRRAFIMCTLICVAGLLLSSTARAANGDARDVVVQQRCHHAFPFAVY